MAERLTILGTGSAFVTRCYNTCFIIDCGVSRLMVDAGGGNGILAQLEKAGVAIADVVAQVLALVDAARTRA